MTRPSLPNLFASFLLAVLIATVWGAIVQTLFNLAALRAIDVEMGEGVVVRTVFRDIFSGFTPTYGGYVVLPALLVAFAAAAWVVLRVAGGAAWFALAGFLAILAAIPLVNWLAPVALLVGASRDAMCTVLMAVGGAVAGLVFAWRLRPRQAGTPLAPPAP